MKSNQGQASTQLSSNSANASSGITKVGKWIRNLRHWRASSAWSIILSLIFSGIIGHSGYIELEQLTSDEPLAGSWPGRAWTGLGQVTWARQKKDRCRVPFATWEFFLCNRITNLVGMDLEILDQTPLASYSTKKRLMMRFFQTLYSSLTRKH